MRWPALALALLLSSCADEKAALRSTVRATSEIAATAAVIHAVVAQFVPQPVIADKLGPHGKADLTIGAVVGLDVLAVLRGIVEIWAWHAAKTTPVDGGVP